MTASGLTWGMSRCPYELIDACALCRLMRLVMKRLAVTAVFAERLHVAFALAAVAEAVYRGASVICGRL